MAFRFRYLHMKPGDETEHAKFVEYVKRAGWPSPAEFGDDRYEMYMPPAWRNPKYMGCKTLHDFQTAKQGGYQKFFNDLMRKRRWQGATERVNYTYDANEYGTCWGQYTTYTVPNMR